MKIRAIAALLFILISVSAFGEGRIKSLVMSVTPTVTPWN